MSPDVRLVPDTAQTQPGQLPVHGLGHGQGDGGFAHARGAHQAEDLALGLGVQLPHGDEFQDPLLHLVQAVVVLVQDLPGLFHVSPVVGLHTPGHVQAHIQIVPDDGPLGAAEGLLGQAVQLLHELLPHLVTGPAAVDLLLVFVQLVVAVLAQLVLQNVQLLPQDHIPLDLAHPLADLLVDIRLQDGDIHLMHQNFVHHQQPPGGMQLLQHPLAILVPEVDVGGDGVRQQAGVPDVQHGGHQLVGQIPHQLLILAKQGVCPPGQSLGAVRGPPALVLQQLHIGLQEGLGLPQAAQGRPVQAPGDDPYPGIRGLDDLENAAHGADLVQVLLLGVLDADLPLGHQQQLPVALHGVFQGQDGYLTLRVEAQRLAREGSQPPQGQHRHILCGHKGISFAIGKVQ